MRQERRNRVSTSASKSAMGQNLASRATRYQNAALDGLNRERCAGDNGCKNLGKAKVSVRAPARAG